MAAMSPDQVPPRAKPTAHDVARRAGVSQSAVSRAFTPGASISPAMRARVVEAAESLGYRPNLIARSLITRRTGMVGVAIGTLANHVYPGMLDLLSRRLAAEGYAVLLFPAPPQGNADPGLEHVMRYQVDALVLAATVVSSRLAEECQAAGIPVILFNRTSGDAGASVTSANREGARALAGLAARGGHRTPAVIAGHPEASTSRERVEGFAEGCRSAGMAEPVVEFGMFTEEGAERALAALLARTPRPDVVFCVSDAMARAAMDAARRDFGLRVPDDISFLGFDDAPPSAWPAYDLTTYRLPVRAMVDATVDLLLESLAAGLPSTRRVVVPGELVVRGSCRLG